MAQAGELKTKVTADISQYEAALKKAEGLAVAAKGKIGTLVSGIATAAAGIGGIGAIAAVATGKGVASIIELGGALTDLSDQTGVSVKNLVVLQRRFEDAGLEAADAGAAINKMQKYLEGIKEDSGKQGLIHELNLSVAELFAMSPEQQFQAIGKAIGSIDGASERAAKSMEIFGKAGGKLTRVFQGDIFANASADLQAKAKSIAENAKLYDEIGDKMGKANNALKTFFMGVAENVAPAISVTIDKLSKIDLKEQGKEFGDNLVRGATAIVGAMEKVGTAYNFLDKLLGERGLGGAAGRTVEYFENRASASDIRKAFSPPPDEVTVERLGDAGNPSAPIPMSGGNRGFGSEDSLLNRFIGSLYMRQQMQRFQAAQGARNSAFYNRMRGGGVDFKAAFNSDALATAVGGRNGLFGTDEATPALGRSPTGLNVDNAERARQVRKRLMEDATFANPLASNAQLNAIVNQQMQQAKDRQKADAIREQINAGRRQRGEAELKPPPMSEAQAAYEAALKNIVTPLIQQQTAEIKTLVAQ